MVRGHLTQPGNILLLLHFQLKENNVRQLQFCYCGHDSLNEAVGSIAPTNHTTLRSRERPRYRFLFFLTRFSILSLVFFCAGRWVLPT